jgi:putative cell wall-binding protein
LDVTATFAPTIISSGGHGGGGGGSVVPTVPTVPITPSTPITSVTRLAGASRVDTAIAIAQANYTGQVSNVILATADNFPDALAGSVLAYKLNAPILLVGTSQDDQNKVLDYLKNSLSTTGTVYVLGGWYAVGDDMVSQVTAEGFANITRLGGSDRYETSLKIASDLDVKQGTPIVLVDGENYPDALSISSVAADMQYPILLVNGDALSDELSQEITSINPTKVYIIGSTGVVSQSIQDQVTQLTSLAPSNIVRLGGTDRFETSLAVAKYFNQPGQDTCIATGNDFPDALAGSVYAAKRNAPIILTNSTLSDDTLAFLKTRKATGITIFGGDGAVSTAVEQQLSQMLAQ